VNTKASLNDLLLYEVSLFRNAYNKKPKGVISIIDALTSIKNGKYRKEISEVRDIYKREGKSDRYREEKKKLPAFTFGGIFEPTQKKENLKRHSGLVIADLDQVGNLVEIKQKICSNPYVLACFNSPSDDGLKFLIRIHVVQNDAEYKSYLQPIARHFKEMYDIDIYFDQDGKDICRLCFVSYDPELYLNENAAIFTENEEAESGYEHLNSRKSPTRSYPEKYSTWKEQAIKSIVNITARSQRGNRHSSRLKSGYLAGGFVAGGMLTEEEILPLLRGVVAANTDLPIDEAFKNVSDSYEAGKSEPITFEMKEVEFEDWLRKTNSTIKLSSNGCFSNNHLQHKKEFSNSNTSVTREGFEYSPKAKLISFREIQQKELPELKWSVSEILPEGYAILASRPKIGKSWLALQFALSVGSGNLALGKFMTEKGNVLYLDLDQGSQRSVKSRLEQLLSICPSEERSAPENVLWSNDINKLSQGGESELISLIEQTKPSLVIIDTLKKFAPVNIKDGYQAEYETGLKIHQIALKYHITILGIHHTTKAKFDYVIDEISGTSGVTAAADTILSIRSTLNGIELYTVGRDVRQENYIIEFDKRTGLWSIAGKKEDYIGGNTDEEKVAQLICASSNGEYDLSIGDMAAILGKNRQIIDTQINRLVKKGIIEAIERGKYKPKDGIKIDSNLLRKWEQRTLNYLEAVLKV